MIRSSDTATVTAHDNSFAGDAVGVRNVEMIGPVDATRNWWGKSTGPTNSGAASAIGNVNFKPWLPARP